MKSKAVKDNLEFLTKNKLEHQFRKNGGNIVCVSYLGDTFYVGLEQFKFRRAGTNKWIKKEHIIVDLNDVLKIPEGYSIPKGFKNKTIKKIIDESPISFKEFLDIAPVLFTQKCLEYLDKDINLKYNNALNWVMPFGKYQGLKLKDIYESNLNYLEWAYLNWEDREDLTDKISVVFEYYSNQ